MLLPSCALLFGAMLLQAQEPPSTASTKTRIVDLKEYPDRSRAAKSNYTLNRSALSDPDAIILSISVNENDCIIYIGSVKYTSQTITIKNPKNTTPQIAAIRQGYAPFAISLYLESGFEYDLAIQLNPQKGWLSVQGDAPVGKILVDGKSMETEQGMIPLSLGYHALTVRSFGFEDYVGTIVASADTVIQMELDFAPAPFSATAGPPSRLKFRPANPGILGSSTIRLNVSGPGTGSLTIFDPQGQQVLFFSFPRFTDWEQTFTWNGKDESGTVLPAGTYMYQLDLHGANDSPDLISHLSGTISIDDYSFLKARLSDSGSSGSSTFMDAYVLDNGGISFDTSLGCQFANQPGSSTMLSLGTISCRWSLLPGLEFATGLEGGIQAESTELPTALFFGGAKYQLAGPRTPETSVSAAISLSGSGLISGDTLPSLRVLNGNQAEARLNFVTQANSGMWFACLDTGLAMTPFAAFDDHADLSLVPRPNFALGTGIDTDTVYFGLGCKLEFLSLEYLVYGFTLETSSATTLSLAQWGMNLPPRIGADLLYTSPWGLAFGLSFFANLFPGASFFDYCGLSGHISFIN